jgi:hypothetical protein
MKTTGSPSLKIDKSAFSVASTFDDSEEKAYWLSRTPHERLQHIEVLRRINYGHKATGRLQRVLEVAECSWD